MSVEKNDKIRIIIRIFGLKCKPFFLLCPDLNKLYI